MAAQIAWSINGDSSSGRVSKRYGPLSTLAPSSGRNADVLEEPLSLEQCIRYVTEALANQKVKITDVSIYAETLLEIPGEELVFNFNFESSNFDTVDGPCSVLENALYESNIEDEEFEVLNQETTWYRNRKKDFKYKLPNDKYTVVFEDKLDVRGTKKRKIIALSDLHLGGCWSEGMDEKLEKYMEGVIEIAQEKVACLVLLGDIFEMWLEKFTEVPPTNDQRVETWRSSLTVLTTAISKLYERGVKIYYVRGNHDHEITKQDVAKLFDHKVTFVPCTLILRIQTADGIEHRARFAHGHEWDIFNSYMLHRVGHLLPDKPIGYYIARAVATTGRGDSDSDLEDLLIGLAKTLLSMMPSIFEGNLVEKLLQPDRQRKLVSRLFEGAFKLNDIDFLVDAKCRVDDKNWIRLQTMLDYPLLRLCGSLVGNQDVFHMIKAATGDYKMFIKRTQEDIVVLAHTHRWDLKRYRNMTGNEVIYANTGCWTSKCEEFSTVVLCPPTESEDGSVVIDYGKNEQKQTHGHSIMNDWVNRLTNRI